MRRCTPATAALAAVVIAVPFLAPHAARAGCPRGRARGATEARHAERRGLQEGLARRVEGETPAGPPPGRPYTRLARWISPGVGRMGTRTRFLHQWPSTRIRAAASRWASFVPLGYLQRCGTTAWKSRGPAYIGNFWSRGMAAQPRTGHWEVAR
jgi:hypothetical protein